MPITPIPWIIPSEAAKAGYDMIGFDGSTMPLEKNIELTRQAVEAVKSINPRIIIEGELGFIGSGSEIHGDRSQEFTILPSQRLMTPKRFVEATQIDVPGFRGKMHGMLKISGSVSRRLDIGRIGELAAATGIPLHPPLEDRERMIFFKEQFRPQAPLLFISAR